MSFKGTPTLRDDFNRANEGPPPSANWTAGHTTSGTGHLVDANQMRGATTGAVHASRWSAATFAADQYAGWRLNTSQGTGNDTAVDLRIQNIGAGATDLIRVRHWRRAADDDVQVSMIVDGSNATARVGPLMTRDFALGDRLLAEAIGDQLLVYRQPSAGGAYTLLGTVLIPTTIGAVASNVGVYGWQSSTTTGLLDDFVAGDSNGHDHPIVVAGALNAAQATTVVPVVPPHLADDVLIVMAAANDASTLSISAGWTEVMAPQSSAVLSYACWWRRVGAGETVTNPTVTQSAAGSSTNAVSARVYRARGCRTTGVPFETATAGLTQSDNAPVTPQLSPANANSAILSLRAIEGSGAWATTAGAGAPPVGADLALIADDTTTQGADMRHTAVVRETDAAGTYTGQSIGTLAAATNIGAVNMILVPAATGPIDTTGAQAGLAVHAGASDMTGSSAQAGLAVHTAASMLEAPTAQQVSVAVHTEVSSVGGEVAAAGTNVSTAVHTAVSDVVAPIDTVGLETTVAVHTGAGGPYTPTGDATSRAVLSGLSELVGPASIDTVGLEVTTAVHTSVSAIDGQIITTGTVTATAVHTGAGGVDAIATVGVQVTVALHAGASAVTPVETVGVQVTTAVHTAASSFTGIIDTDATVVTVATHTGVSGDATGFPYPVQPRPPEWRFELVSFEGERLAEITPRGRTVRLVLGGAGSAGFGFDVLEAAPLRDLLVVGEVDLLVSREARRIFRGPIGGATGSSLTASGGALSFIATGILELLGDRFIPAGRELAALEQTRMAWQLVADAQVGVGASLGISSGSLPDSIARTKSWETPTPVLQALRELSDLADGFDFAIEPDDAGAYRFDAYYPRRGSNRGVVLEAGRNIKAISPTWDAGPGRIANRVTAVGADQVGVTAEDTASRDRYRRRDRIVSVADADDVTLLGDRAQGELDRDAVVRPRGSLELLEGAPEADLGSLGLGDVVEVDFDAGWASFTGLYRLTELQIVLPEGEGAEKITATVEPFDG